MMKKKIWALILMIRALLMMILEPPVKILKVTPLIPCQIMNMKGSCTIKIEA